MPGTLDRSLDGDGTEVGRSQAGKAALKTAHGGTGGGNDNDRVIHADFS
jgi:hypothetical protein